MRAVAASAMEVVPSDQGRLSSILTRPSGNRREVVVGQRWSQHVTAQPLAAGAVVGGDATGGVQVETTILRAQAALHLGSGARGNGEAHRCALVRRSCRWRAGDRGTEQARQQRVGFAYRFVPGHGQLAVTGGGHHGDYATTLEVAQDAPACLVNHRLHIRVGRPRRRVKQRRPSPPVGQVHAVQEQHVKVRIEPQIARTALDHRHCPAPATAQTPPFLPLAIPGAHRVDEDPQHRCQQAPVEGQREPQRVRHGQHPLPDRDLGQDVVHQVGGTFIHPATQAARTEASALAAKRHQMPLATSLAEQLGDAPGERTV